MSDNWVYTSKGYKNVERDDYDPPPPDYTCGECGRKFWYPAEDDLRQDCCPYCGSTNISEIADDDEWDDEEDDNVETQ